MSYGLSSRSLRFAGSAALFLLAILTLGCGPRAEGLHPVQGRFVAPDGGEVSILAGHLVETRLDSDPLVFSSAEIGPDGSFVLETLHQGEILPGAFEGSHAVRIVLNEDDKEKREIAKKALDPTLLDFDKSGLRIESPSPSDPQLEVRFKK